MKLKDSECKNAKGKTKPYKLGDGKGLYLEVTTKGAKYWRLKYRIDNKEKRLSIGVYPAVTLKQARDAMLKAKELIVLDVIFPSVIYIFLRGCRYEYAQTNPFNAT